jgi:hypothetical protein
MSYRAARALIEDVVNESPLNTAGGVYYVLRYPKGWRFEPNKNDIDPETDHRGLWEELSFVLASQWAPIIATPRDQLYAQLLLLHQAFPRGRVVVQGLRHFVRHGGNLQSWMGVSHHRVEAYYGLSAPEWVLDSHECCPCAQKEQLRKLLNMNDDWPCT